MHFGSSIETDRRNGYYEHFLGRTELHAYRPVFAETLRSMMRIEGARFKFLSTYRIRLSR